MDYSQLVPAPPSTRSSATTPCSCTVCSIARMTNNEYLKYTQGHTNKLGRPSEYPQSEPPKNITICDKCLTAVAPGKNHICQKHVKRENIVTLIRNSSEKSKSSVIVSGLKEIAEEQGESSRVVP